MRRTGLVGALVLVACTALTLFAGAANAQDVELRGSPQRFNDHVYGCLERMLAKNPPLITINKANPQLLIDAFYPRAAEIANYTNACIGYAHIWANVEVATVKLPSKGDVAALKESVDALTRALNDMKTTTEARDKAMAEKFQTNFINALACAFATNEKVRETACAGK